MNQLNTQAISRLLVLGCLLLTASVGGTNAAALPKGNCADPKPYTDLRHCHFAGKDLRNKDLSGTDLRMEYLNETQLQGANLTKSIFKRLDLMKAELDGAQGLPQEFLNEYAIFKRFSNKYYLVTSKGKSNASITLTPHKAVDVIQKDIAGLTNPIMLSKMKNQSHTVALLDWPRLMDGPMMSIIARFDKDQDPVPTCYQPVSLIAEEEYFYPGWDKMTVRPLGNRAYLIGVKAKGADGYGDGNTGWQKIAILKLSSDCNLSVLYEEKVGWWKDYDGKACKGEYLDYDFVNDQAAVIKKTELMCGSLSKPKTKTTYKKIKLN